MCIYFDSPKYLYTVHHQDTGMINLRAAIKLSLLFSLGSASLLFICMDKQQDPAKSGCHAVP